MRLPRINFKIRFSVWMPVFFLCALLYLLIFPLATGSFGEWSWDYPTLYGMCAAAKHGLITGKDFFHVLGPLGHLYKPVPVDGTGVYGQYLIYTVLLNAVFLSIIFRFCCSAGHWSRGAILLLVQIALMDVFASVDMLPITIGLYALFLDIQRPRSYAYIPAAFLAALGIFTKFNHGITLSVLYGAHVLASRWLKKESWKETAAKCAVYLIPVFVLGWFLFGSPAAFGRYVGTLMEMASQYSLQSTMLGHPSELPLALLVVSFIIPLALRIRAAHGNRIALYWLLIIGMACFFNLKHAFVAQWSHLVFFVRFIPALIASALFFLPARRVLFFIISAVVICSLSYSFRHEFINPFQNFRHAGLRNIRILTHFKETCKKAEDGTRDFLLNQNTSYQTALLNENALRLIGDGTVDTVRHFTPYIDFFGLRWKPSPFTFFQHSMSERMDLANAAHFESNRAADYFILSWESMNGMHPLFPAPATYLSILKNYEFAAQDRGYLLLKKRPTRAISNTYLTTVRTPWNEDVEIPESPTLVVAEIRASLTLKGRLMKVLFRIPPTVITLVSEEGRHYSYRFITNTSGSGLIVNYLPLDLDEIKSLFESGTVNPFSQSFTSLRLHLDNRGGLFSDTVEIRFYELGFKALPKATVTTTAEEYLRGLQETNLEDFAHYIDGATVTLPVQPGPRKNTRGAIAHIHGWATDLETTVSYKDMMIEISGKLYEPRRMQRPDVAAAHAADDLAQSGFALRARGVKLTGPEFRIYVRHRDNATYRVLGARFQNTEDYDYKLATVTQPDNITPEQYLSGLQKTEPAGHLYYMDAAYLESADPPSGDGPPLIHMWGWAADLDKISSFEDMRVEIGGRLYRPDRLPRPDVAQAHGSPDLDRSGFILTAEAANLEQTYRVHIRHRDSKTYRTYEVKI